jgi:hypothetical protein
MKSEIGTGNTILLRIEMPLGAFLNKFKSTSQFFRRWRYSQNSINGMSNFQFGNFFITGGYYFHQVQSNKLEINYLFFLRKSSPIISTNLIQRIKKVVPNGFISIIQSENMPELIQHPMGTKLMRTFGSFYATKRNSPISSSSSLKKVKTNCSV